MVKTYPPRRRPLPVRTFKHSPDLPIELRYQIFEDAVCNEIEGQEIRKVNVKASTAKQKNVVKVRF
jgi:hypothetical protein